MQQKFRYYVFGGLLVVLFGSLLIACGAKAASGNAKNNAVVSDATTSDTPTSTAQKSNAVTMENEVADGPFVAAMNPERDYLTVVNASYPYEFGGDYDRQLQNDLILVGDADTGEPTYVEKGAWLAFTQLQSALAKKGVFIGLYSAYRNEADQKWVYEHYHGLEGWDDGKSVNKVVPEGYSEHHTGLMINYVIMREKSDGSGWEAATITAENKEQFPAYQTIVETLPEYGFILRYPANHEMMTGVGEEPYEIRFVGSVQIAKQIADNSITLEEYTRKVVKG